MKTYMPLNGLRWSRNSGSANCDMPQSAVFGRPGGGWSTESDNTRVSTIMIDVSKHFAAMKSAIGDYLRMGGSTFSSYKSAASRSLSRI